MWVITRRALKAFWERHPESEPRLRQWYKVETAADWQTFADVRQTFAAADLVGRLVVFNVGGNNYRVVTRIDFTHRKVYIRHVMTHAEYSTDVWRRDPWF